MISRIDFTSLIYFLLILMRMSGMIALNPALGRKNVPAIIKNGLILVLTYVVFSVSTPELPVFHTVFELGYLLLKEFIMGYIFGFVMSLFLLVIIYAGEIMDIQLGIAMAKVFDPQTNASISIMASFYNGIFMLLFFGVNGHLALVRMILTSGDAVPYGRVTIDPGIVQVIIDIFCQSLFLGVQFSMPILAAEMLAEISVGMLMKAIPQINVFVINIQMKLFIGFVLLFLFSSPFASYLEELLSVMLDTMNNMLGYF